jgi:LmbE family N-acetylglucosaminyl deacetylase
MVVVAHADDAEWGCSGTVAKWCAEGWDVVYVICTDGSKGSGDPEMTSERLVKIREAEQQNAGKVLGLHDVVFLGYEDSMLEPTLSLRRDIVRAIRRHKPDVLICVSPIRQLSDGWLGHPDHVAAGEAAMSAVYPAARDRLTFPELLEEGLQPHNVRELWVSDHHEADNYVDVTDYIEVAAQALRQHVTQVLEEDIDTHLKLGRSQTGERVGFRYAEAFKRFRLY